MAKKKEKKRKKKETRYGLSDRLFFVF